MGEISPLRGHSAMSRDIFRCHHSGMGGGGQRYYQPRVLL